MSSESNGAVCGGVVMQSEANKNPMAYMMAWIMPDKQFAEYKKLKEAGNSKEANKIFDKYARSVI